MGKKNGDDQQLTMDIHGDQHTSPAMRLRWETTRASALGNTKKSITSGLKSLDDKDGLFLLMEIREWCDKQIAGMRSRGVG